MTAPRVLVRIVASQEIAGLVSLRVLVGGHEMPSEYLRHALTEAGFRPGDIAAIELANEEETQS